MKLEVPWMDVLRIEYALGYSVKLDVHGVPFDMARISPLDRYQGEWMIKLWLEDTREMMRHGLVEVGVWVDGAWYLWTIDTGRDFYKTVDLVNDFN